MDFTTSEERILLMGTDYWNKPFRHTAGITDDWWLQCMGFTAIDNNNTWRKNGRQSILQVEKVYKDKRILWVAKHLTMDGLIVQVTEERTRPATAIDDILDSYAWRLKQEAMG